jgi:2-keto-3-deoxy-6-phosphogluconate aldolase
MTRVKLDRAAIVRQIEELGVVAVIRLRDPGKLRAVVDALMA